MYFYNLFPDELTVGRLVHLVSCNLVAILLLLGCRVCLWVPLFQLGIMFYSILLLEHHPGNSFSLISIKIILETLLYSFLLCLCMFVHVLSQCLLQYPIHTYPDLLHTSAAETRCTNACVLWKVCWCSDCSVLLPYWTTKYQLTDTQINKVIWERKLSLSATTSPNLSVYSLYNIEISFPNVCCEAYFYTRF